MCLGPHTHPIELCLAPWVSLSQDSKALSSAPLVSVPTGPSPLVFPSPGKTRNPARDWSADSRSRRLPRLSPGTPSVPTHASLSLSPFLPGLVWVLLGGHGEGQDSQLSRPLENPKKRVTSLPPAAAPSQVDTGTLIQVHAHMQSHSIHSFIVRRSHAHLLPVLTLVSPQVPPRLA